jgi:hypothetical protein
MPEDMQGSSISFLRRVMAVPETFGRVLFASMLGLALAGPPTLAQESNPADQPKPESSADQNPEHQPSWKIEGDSVTVIGEPLSELREEERIGAYHQPRWTARRRFGETRVYVIPRGDFEFEHWLVPTYPREGGETEIDQQYEVEMGLPRRFQLDLYAVTQKTGNSGSLGLDQTKVELRWALADWGRLWGNPALYLEWIGIDNASDHVETKLLFGGEIAPRLHWGANLVFEHEMGGEQTNSYEWTGGLSYTVRDEKWSVGAETKLAWEDVKASRGTYTREVLLGPSFQFRPLPQAHLDLVTLAGLGHDSPRGKATVILGWEF